jgi:hypothetical protein
VHVQIRDQFPDAEIGAILDFRGPDLELAIVALARVGGQRGGLVAKVLDLVDAVGALSSEAPPITRAERRPTPSAPNSSRR